MKLCDFLESIESLSNKIIVTDTGQSFFEVTRMKLKEGDRMICSYAQSDMGFALPASIGVAFASSKPVMVIIGDGSFQLNIQELQVIKHHNLPIKIFVINNNGYETNRNTQKRYFNRFIGIDKKTGVSFPELNKIAHAYDLDYYSYHPDLLNEIVKSKKPIICEVEINESTI